MKPLRAVTVKITERYEIDTNQHKYSVGLLYNVALLVLISYNTGYFQSFNNEKLNNDNTTVKIIIQF